MGEVVMIDEDEAIIAMVSQLNLEQAGYQVCGIASSEEGALDLARRHRPDLAVIDLALSPGNGARVARHLSREIGTGVFLVSAEPNLQKTARDVGVLAATKPFDTALLPLAFEYVRRHRTGRPLTAPPPWLLGCPIPSIPSCARHHAVHRPTDSPG